MFVLGVNKPDEGLYADGKSPPRLSLFFRELERRPDVLVSLLDGSQDGGVRHGAELLIAPIFQMWWWCLPLLEDVIMTLISGGVGMNEVWRHDRPESQCPTPSPDNASTTDIGLIGG